MKKWKKRIRSVFLLFLALLFLENLQHYAAYVVLSGSMEPAVHTGSLIITDCRKEEWKAGDIITFQKNNVVVTHRILEVCEDGYITKGDANKSEDFGKTEKNAVRGKLLCSIPYAGYVMVWIQQNFAVVLAGFMGLLLWTIFWHCWMQRKEQEEYEQKQQEEYANEEKRKDRNLGSIDGALRCARGRGNSGIFNR